jgi:hypothetical protein
MQFLSQGVIPLTLTPMNANRGGNRNEDTNANRKASALRLFRTRKFTETSHQLLSLLSYTLCRLIFCVYPSGFNFMTFHAVLLLFDFTIGVKVPRAHRRPRS